MLKIFTFCLIFISFLALAEEVDSQAFNACYSPDIEQIIVAGSTTTFHAPTNKGVMIMVLGEKHKVSVNLDGEGPITKVCVFYAGAASNIDVNINAPTDSIYLRALGNTGAISFKTGENGSITSGVLHLYGNALSVSVVGKGANCYGLNWLNFGVGNSFFCGDAL